MRARIPTVYEVTVARKKIDKANGGFSGCAESTSEFAESLVCFDGQGWEKGQVAYGIQIGMQIAETRLMENSRIHVMNPRRERA